MKKKLADAYMQWACLRMVCKRWLGIASLCVVYPKYERKKLVYLARVAEEANQYEGKLYVEDEKVNFHNPTQYLHIPCS